jgi:xanthine dehydrogenase FAD-binding subunit
VSAELVSPHTRDELCAALARATPRSVLLAGGTDLVRVLWRERRRPDLIIDLSNMADLAFVRLHQGAVHIGAATTFAQLQADPLVRRHARCLADAAAQVGSPQIRNAASIGGNLVNASACADGMPPLVALGARVSVLDSHGHTTMRPIGDVMAGSGRTTLRCGEAITEISFPALQEHQRAAFVKIGSRSSVTVAKLSMALIAAYDAAAGTLHEARVALGAVADVAFRDTVLEQALEGRRAEAESARHFAVECAAAVQRAIPERPSLAYKRAAAWGLAYDAWNALSVCSPCEPAGECDR